MDIRMKTERASSESKHAEEERLWLTAENTII